MTEKNNDLESLSRLREIIFGEQMAKLEEEIKNLSTDSKINFERFTNEFKRLIKEVEDNFNKLLKEQKEAFELKLQQLSDSKADSKKLADTFRSLADSFDKKD